MAAHAKYIARSSVTIRDGATQAAYPLTLLALFAIWWTALAIAPQYRQDWALENAIVAVAIPILILTYGNLRFLNAAYTCLFVFFVLHEVGSHYTRAEVPYDEWATYQTGTSVSEVLGATDAGEVLRLAGVDCRKL